jgi:FeS assembly SUF system protein
MADVDETRQEHPPAEAPAAPGPAEPSPAELREKVIDQLRTVFDPEIPVNIYELGLIYEVRVEEQGKAFVKMTLTSPMCPAAEELPPEVETKARSVPGVSSVELDLVWDPPWSPDMMSEAAKLELGML